MKMGSFMQLPQEASRLWGNPITRKRILDLHARNATLIEMVTDLGLTAAMEADGLTDIITALTPAEVQIIRNVFFAEAKLAADHAGASFPIDCRVDQPRDRVHITEVPGGTNSAGPVAQINAP